MRTLAFLGLLPSLLVSAYALGAIWVSAFQFLSGDFLAGGINLIAGCAVLIGSYSLGRFALGESASRFYPGLIVGLGVVTALTVSPIILRITERLGFWECRFSSGLDCYGGAIGISMIAVFALPVFLCVSIRAMLERRRQPHHDDARS